MHGKWITEKDFVTDIVFRYTVTAYQSLLWLPEEQEAQLLLGDRATPKHAKDS